VLASVQSTSQPQPSAPPQRCAPLMDFHSLQHLPDARIHSRGSSTSRCGPPSGFGYPLGGLRPSHLVGLVSCRQRSWDFALRSVPLSPGIRPVSESEAPTYRFTRTCSFRPKANGRPCGPRFLGFGPSESSWPPNAGLARRTTGCSHGLRPFQGLSAVALAGISPSLLSHGSHGQPKPAARRPRVSISVGLTEPTGLMRTPPNFANPLRVLAPSCAPDR